VWAPYYVVHKIMAGLLDAHTMARSADALAMVTAMADYHHARTAQVVSLKGEEYWFKTLETEFGGMNDVMYRLYRVTKQQAHLQLARWFDKPRWWAALKEGRDPLPYSHANTHLAQVVGYAERADATGDEEARQVVATFFDILTTNHSYATGGSNAREFWQTPAMLGDSIVKQDTAYETQEICTQYNVLKIARSLFTWTGDVKYADFYEQALVNGILGVSRLTNDEVWDAEAAGPGGDGLAGMLERHSHGLRAGAAAVRAARKLLEDAGAGRAGALQASQSEEFSLGLDLGLDHHHHHHGHGHKHGSGHSHDHARALTSTQHASVMHKSDSDLLGAESQAGTTYPKWGGGDASQVLQGKLAGGIDPAHYFRAAAAGHADPQAMTAFSLAQEPSMLAEPSGAPLSTKPPPDGPGGSVAPYTRAFNLKFQDYWSFNLAHMPSRDSAVNAPGTPGSFLYLLPLGAGQSKRDNFHHWGYPLHSFWCCYGTAVESFAKLADSIYFYESGKNVDDEQAGLGDTDLDAELPVLYVNQYVSSELTWRELGVGVKAAATMFGANGFLEASLTFSHTGEPRANGIPFVVKLRVPAWAQAAVLGRSKVYVQVTINGQVWGWHDDESTAPGAYFDVVRRWKAGDVLGVRIKQGYRLARLPDTREEYSRLAAIMMGPHLMAGLTHDARNLRLPAGEDSLEGVVTDPHALPRQLVGIVTAANSSLYVRADRYHAYQSVLTDSGDALDATWVVRQDCTYAQLPQEGELVPPDPQRGASAADMLAQGGGVPRGTEVMIEAAGMPGFFLGMQPFDNMAVLDQFESSPPYVEWEARRAAEAKVGRARGGAAGGAKAGGGFQEEAVTPEDKVHNQFCRTHSFNVVPGLDGSPDTVSFEATDFTGRYLTAAKPLFPECRDTEKQCHSASRRGLCVSEPERWVPRCPMSCGTCRLQPASLNFAVLDTRQTKGDMGAKLSPAAAKAASFRFTTAPAHRFPPGTKVVHGTNRRYLIAPLGNLVDERYTAYFDVHIPGKEPPLSAAAQAEMDALAAEDDKLWSRAGEYTEADAAFYAAEAAAVAAAKKANAGKAGA